MVRGSQQQSVSRKSRRKSRHVSLEVPVNEKLQNLLSELGTLSCVVPTNCHTKSLVKNLEKLVADFKTAVEHNSTNSGELSYPASSAELVYLRQIRDPVSDGQYASQEEQQQVTNAQPGHMIIDSYVPPKQPRLDLSHVVPASASINQLTTSHQVITTEIPSRVSNSYLDVSASLLPTHRFLPHSGSGANHLLVSPLASVQQFGSASLSHPLDSGRMNAVGTIRDDSYLPNHHADSTVFVPVTNSHFTQLKGSADNSQSYVHSLPKAARTQPL